MVIYDTLLFLKMSPLYSAFCSNYCTYPHGMKIYFLFFLFMILQGLATTKNPFQEWKDDNNMGSIDCVKL